MTSQLIDVDKANAKLSLIRAALVAAKEKLQLYRDHYGSEYLGGMEFSALMRKIDSALAEFK